MKELVVLVHGTVSAGMRMAAAIYPNLTSDYPPFVKAWPRVCVLNTIPLHPAK
jgi:hypothetical protein